ncbi:hypothetical protein BRC65_04180 [Halobacteriales archaeon QH_2_65_14]|nr:MAG: hypothetical protein BRC65_04180 [Halobacteriales archaeon QH_2_65_14]
MRETPLSSDERDVLEALYTADDQADLFDILDKDPETLRETPDRLIVVVVISYCRGVTPRPFQPPKQG